MIQQPPLFGADGYDAGAAITPCGRYRTALWREWGNGSSRCLFIMLNPSTADASLDDPTIRRCIDFTKRWGHNALDVVNLFSWRATDPRELLTASDPVGPGEPIIEAISRGSCRRVICAWGSPTLSRLKKLVIERAAEVWRTILLTQRFHNAPPIECLGVAKGGQPRHPLYIPRDLVPTPFGGAR